MALNRGSTGLNVYRGSTQQKVYRGSTLIVEPTSPTATYTGMLRRVNSGNIRLLGSYTNSGDPDTSFSSAISGFQLPAEWMAGDSIAYVRIFGVINVGSGDGGRLTLQLNSADTGDGGSAGPDLTSDLETTLQVTVEVGTNSISLDVSNANLDDTEEPYTWNFNTSGSRAFMDALSLGLHTATITLTNPN